MGAASVVCRESLTSLHQPVLDPSAVHLQTPLGLGTKETRPPQRVRWGQPLRKEPITRSGLWVSHSSPFFIQCNISADSAACLQFYGYHCDP